MKKLLFLFVAIAAMAGFANAQSTLCRDLACECSPDIKTGPGSCDKVQGHGACDDNRLCVNLDDDLANCGKLGRVCKEDEDCSNGTCSKEGIILPSTNPAIPPVMVDTPLPLKHKRKYLVLTSLTQS